VYDSRLSHERFHMNAACATSGPPKRPSVEAAAYPSAMLVGEEESHRHPAEHLANFAQPLRKPPEAEEGGVVRPVLAAQHKYRVSVQGLNPHSVDVRFEGVESRRPPSTTA
jgi:hypothetical protein